MKSKLTTAKKSEDILSDLERKTHIGRNILARYAIALSLIHIDEDLKFNKDRSGFELNRSTLTGKYDSIFKGLMALNRKEIVDDKDFLKDLKKHLDRGSVLLERTYKYSKNKERFILELLNYSNK